MSTIRRWIFLATDWDDKQFYLGAGGEQIDETQAVPFVGRDDEAMVEGDRRADLWEIANNAFVAEIAAQSQGIVSGARQ